ncbi:hypothetical protein BH20VER3_BH20VER3_08570 [soil metagenome]
MTSLKHKLELTFCGYAIFSTALFFVTGIAYQVLGRWPVTHQDFWRIYDTCLHRSWMYSALLKYNGHSHFFPSQFWLVDLRFFHGNQDFLFAFGLSFEIAGTALFLLPVWRDRRIHITTKLFSSMIIVVFTFWMGRASMTVSGGFNCCYSLVLVGAALAFYSLGFATEQKRRETVVLTGVVVGGLLATFSFGTGLAVWAAALATGYCLRFRFTLLIALGFAGAAAALIFIMLPTQEARGPHIAQTDWFHVSTYVSLLHYFFHLLGSPLLQMCTTWIPQKTLAPSLSDLVATTFGATGGTLGVVVLVRQLARRNLQFGLASTGFAIMIFNLFAFILITLARADHIASVPGELDAPRYYYWSSLFWAGLLLFGLRLSETRRVLRAPMVCAMLAIPVFAFPSHYHEGWRWRHVRLLSNEAATSLLNGVKDPQQIKILSPYPDLVFRLASEMRARRLDMFAAGYQDWFDRPASKVFGQNRRVAGFKGRCQIRLLSTQPVAARINGSAVHGEKMIPEISVVIDSRDLVRGVARSASTPRWINWLLYDGIFQPRKFVGFIAPYDPREQYSLRSVEGTMLSSEAMRIPPPPTQLGGGR